MRADFFTLVRGAVVISLAEESLDVSDAVIARVLIADDQPDILEVLSMLLRNHGYQVHTVSSPAAILEALRE